MNGRWRTVSLLLRHIAASSKSTTLHLPRRPPPSNPTRRFLSFRASSAIPYRVSVDSNDFDSSVPPILDYNYELGAQEDDECVKISVKAHPRTFKTFEELIAHYKSGELHRADLKPALTKSLNKILEPVRGHF